MNQTFPIQLALVIPVLGVVGFLFRLYVAALNDRIKEANDRAARLEGELKEKNAFIATEVIKALQQGIAATKTIGDLNLDLVVLIDRLKDRREAS